MIIKKIFEEIFDDEVHSGFLKYGKGEYKSKFLLEGKKQANKWAIKTGPELANCLVKRCLKKVKEKVLVKGIIVSTNDLRSEVPFPIEKVGNFQGVRKHVINTEIEPLDLIKVMEERPRTFFGLSFKGEDFDLKIKAKAPTSGKPGKDSDEGPRADFCSLKTNDRGLVEELFFDESNFTESIISHTVKVEDIVYPSNLNSLSPKEVRENSKRKGVIYRKSVVDGKEKITEAKFTA
ncbi:MAG: hypothetical protein NUV97_02445 [archaeon]|nr:hypothetical protein [archaeon]MCR4323806.1 hypothetical protein [Nanoarchaeota archaeon]